MHARNWDRPYRSSADAMTHWLETPTAVGVRLSTTGRGDILAPFGLTDLIELMIRPTPHAWHHRRDGFRQRLAGKRWLEQWPRARVAMEAATSG